MHAAEPAGAAVPGAQAAQVAAEEAPVALEKVPAGQSAALVEEGGQKEPAVQSKHELAEGLNEPAAQVTQVAELLAPTAVLNVPGAQLVQDGAPGMLL